MSPTTATTADQAHLFAVTDTTGAKAVVSGVRFIAADPAANDAALTGDGYDWLAAALPPPKPARCPACHRPAVLPAAAPVLWTCPHCHATEAR
ncbi:hypothetical protein [Nonomuraea sp. NPDC049141]|uniref:hypothetical protein n=1 Tax=Nonomuraea sp. NPDC049141 TaxID=3155500 RepID=UPI0034006913